MNRNKSWAPSGTVYWVLAGTRRFGLSVVGGYVLLETTRKLYIAICLCSDKTSHRKNQMNYDKGYGTPNDHSQMSTSALLRPARNPATHHGKSWKIIENHGHNNYGHFWSFYGEIIFK